MLLVVNCNYEIVQKDAVESWMQKLTDRLFRGFGIRERAHFHPVGQSPGGKVMQESERAKEDGGRKRVKRSETHSEQMLRGE